MQSQAQSRKRPAPGTSPMVQQQPTPPQPAYSYQQMSENPDFSNFDFSQHFNPDQSQNFNDPIFSPNNDFSYLQNTSQPAAYGGNVTAPASASTDLIRRPRAQQLAVPGSAQQQEQWNGGFGGMNGQNEDDDEQDLDRKVQLAKRDAQGKRKQIPPFVQKLSSFLDSSHTDLIRWSDDGRSFIVLDEDEFARTLIPELFKHNNYASFVRQLNMYGFHKTVNITDGSLRQSEKARKGVKPPSMYSHPYFRKNRPDLLWLIQKPSTKSGAKRKRDGAIKDDYASDDERSFSPGPAGAPVGELPAPGPSGGGDGASGQEMATLPRNELTSVRHELQRLQSQQRFISKMITQLKEQNDAFYRQASAFQALHDRHENSINAILTFLATFYNRSLESHGGAQNLVNLFNSNVQNQNQEQDRVVEEFNDGASENSGQVQRFPKKPQLLLGAGPVASYQQQMARQQRGQATTQPNSERSSLSPPNAGSQRGSASSARPERPSNLKPNSSASPVVKTDAPTPNMLNQVPENDQMMSLINSVNATNANTPSTAAPAFDFTSALDHYQTANGNAPLTPQQRDDMLALMAANQPQQPSNSSSSTTAGGPRHHDNALISPQPPAMPDLEQLKQTQHQLDMLTNLQKQQDAKVQELNRKLQPLSPTGAIPGLHGQSASDENPFDFPGAAPGDYDPNAFIDFDDGAWGPASSASARHASPAAAAGQKVDDHDDDALNFDFGNGPIGSGAGEGVGEINWDFTNDSGGDMFQTSADGTTGGFGGGFGDGGSWGEEAHAGGGGGGGGGGWDGGDGGEGEGGAGGGGGRVESVSSSSATASPRQPPAGGGGGGEESVGRASTPNKRSRRS